MPDISIRTVKRWSVLPLGITAAIHLGLGLAGVGQYLASGHLPSVLHPFFLASGIAMLAGLVAFLRGYFAPSRAYALGAVLMAIHLLAYIDWHVLQTFEWVVDSPEYGHDHAHVDGQGHDSLFGLLPLEDPLVAGVVTLFGSSAVVQFGSHVVASPIDLLAKCSELLLLGVFLLLRWADSNDVGRLRWDFELEDIAGGAGLIGLGIGLWLTTRILSAILEPVAVAEAVLGVLELAGFGAVLFGVVWSGMVAPIVNQSSSPTARPITLSRHVPGMIPGNDRRNIRVGAVILMGGVVLFAGIVGFAPAIDSGSHQHGHGEDALDDVTAALAEEDIEVDRNWSMVHHSEYHGGDALLLDYFTNHPDDPAGIEAEIPIVLQAVVDVVAAGGFDSVVVVFADVRSPRDESLVWWEIDIEWVERYLTGEWSWAELVERVLATTEDRTTHSYR